MNSGDEIHVLSRAVVVHNNKILLCKTLDLDVNFYFLPGGHVEHGESAEECCLRELKEEAGVEGKIEKFLGCLEYSFEPGHSSICHNHEYNFIFEVHSNELKSDKKIICPEKHIELIWMAVSCLQEIDFRAEPLRKLLPLWLSGDLENTFMSGMG